MVEEHRHALAELDLNDADLSDLKQETWTHALSACMQQLRRGADDIAHDKKAADWKIAIAAHLRKVTTAKNPWLAEQLNMGDPDGVSRYLSELRQGQRPCAALLAAEITDIRV